jgi:hypothetical protein
VNLSKRQVDCLKAMGIPLWQSRAKITTEPPVTVEPQAELAVQPPLLIAQLEHAITYCRKHGNGAIELSWKIDDKLEQIELANSQLSLPNLTKVFANAKLKQQLWSLIHHANK